MRKAVVVVVLALVASTTSAAVGGGRVPAAAVPLPGEPPPHWGQSPFFPQCHEGPCRAVLVIDKTFDPAWSAQIRRWVHWITLVRVHHNLDLPALGYFGADEGILPDPSCHGFETAVTICVNDAVVEADCNDVEASLLCIQTTRRVPGNHFYAVRLSIRDRDFEPADRWNIVCAYLGRAIGLSNAQPDPESCMNQPGFLGQGVERYYVADDWNTLWSLYGHPAAQ